jgi:undecaprenyl-diphosphatase
MNDYLLSAINGWAGDNGILDAAMRFCAEYLVYIVFLVAILWLAYALYKREFARIGWFVLNLVVAFVLLEIAKHAYIEQRPFVSHHVTQLVTHAANQSFPSDHTTGASAIALGFLGFTRFKKTGILLFLAALLIGFARIFVGVHYPDDIGGAVLIALIALPITEGIRKLCNGRRRVGDKQAG